MLGVTTETESPEEQLKAALEAAFADGIITEDERTLLKQIRELLGVPVDRANEIMAEVKSNSQKTNSIDQNEVVEAEKESRESTNAQEVLENQVPTSEYQTAIPVEEQTVDSAGDQTRCGVDDAVIDSKASCFHSYKRGKDGQLVCSKCGSSLGQGGSANRADGTCAGCGAAIKPTDRVCSYCGAPAVENIMLATRAGINPDKCPHVWRYTQRGIICVNCGLSRELDSPRERRKQAQALQLLVCYYCGSSVRENQQHCDKCNRKIKSIVPIPRNIKIYDPNDARLSVQPIRCPYCSANTYAMTECCPSCGFGLYRSGRRRVKRLSETDRNKIGLFSGTSIGDDDSDDPGKFGLKPLDDSERLYFRAVAHYKKIEIQYVIPGLEHDVTEKTRADIHYAVPREVLTTADSGTLYLTNYRVHFSGPRYTISSLFCNMSSFACGSGTVECMDMTSSESILFATDYADIFGNVKTFIDNPSEGMLEAARSLRYWFPKYKSVLEIIEIINLPARNEVETGPFTIQGRVPLGYQAWINDEIVDIDNQTHEYSKTVEIADGENVFVFKTYDENGSPCSRTVVINGVPGFEEYKELCVDGPKFNELEKDASKYVGMRCMYVGEASFVDESQEETVIQLHPTRTEYGSWTDSIIVNLRGKTEALKDNIVAVYGILDGYQIRSTIIGVERAFPLLRARYIEVLAENSAAFKEVGLSRLQEEISSGIRELNVTVEGFFSEHNLEGKGIDNDIVVELSKYMAAAKIENKEDGFSCTECTITTTLLDEDNSVLATRQDKYGPVDPGESWFVSEKLDPKGHLPKNVEFRILAEKWDKAETKPGEIEVIKCRYIVNEDKGSTYITGMISYHGQLTSVSGKLYGVLLNKEGIPIGGAYPSYRDRLNIGHGNNPFEIEVEMTSDQIETAEVSFICDT